MATAGPNTSGTQTVTERGGLTPTWATLSNVNASDNTRAQTGSMTTTATQTPSDYADLTNFGFSVPSGATINGVTVAIERSAASGNVQDDTVQLIKGGTASGTNKADTATNWPAAGSEASVNYGGVADLWSLTLTDTDVNASNFGVRIAAKTASTGTNIAQIDLVTITITYTAAAVSTRRLGLLGVGT